jgi:hypothetical protein
MTCTLTAVPRSSGDALATAVGHRPVAGPRAEHGVDGPGELGARVGREGRARALLDLLEGPRHDVAQGGDGQRRVGRHPGGGARLVDEGGERPGVELQHDRGVHGDEAPVGVEGEALVGLGREPRHRRLVQAEVEDGVHHPRHRDRRAGPHADEHRVEWVPEAATEGGLQPGHRLVDLGGEPLGPGPVKGLGARPGADREAGRHREPQDRRHLGQVGALPAEQAGEGPRRHAVVVVEVVDVPHGDLPGG